MWTLSFTSVRIVEQLIWTRGPYNDRGSDAPFPWRIRKLPNVRSGVRCISSWNPFAVAKHSNTLPQGHTCQCVAAVLGSERREVSRGQLSGIGCSVLLHARCICFKFSGFSSNLITLRATLFTIETSEVTKAPVWFLWMMLTSARFYALNHIQVLHNNWIKGLGNKVRRLVEQDLWYFDREAEICIYDEAPRVDFTWAEAYKDEQ